MTNTPDVEKHCDTKIEDILHKLFDPFKETAVLRKTNVRAAIEEARRERDMEIVALKASITRIQRETVRRVLDRFYEIAGLDDPECWHGCHVKDCDAEQCEGRAVQKYYKLLTTTDHEK